MKPKDFFQKIRDDRKPGEEFSGALRASLVEYMRSNPPDPLPIKNSAPWRKGAVISFVSLIIVGTSAVGTVFAAQQAQPGDALYGIKLATDQWSVDITRSPAVRVSVANRRIEEIQQALAAPSAENNHVQADIQSALKQYKLVSQGEGTFTISSSSVPTPVSITRDKPLIPEKIRTDEENNIKIVSANHSADNTNTTTTTAQDRKDGLRVSRQVEDTVHVALENTGTAPTTTSEKINAISPASSTHETPTDHNDDALPITITTSTFSKSTSSQPQTQHDKTDWQQSENDHDMKDHPSSTSTPTSSPSHE